MEPDIDAILWHSQGHYIDVIYESGNADRLMATHDVAHAFAREVDLPFQSRTEDTVRWQRSQHDARGPDELE